jgi:hypothetical protein
MKAVDREQARRRSGLIAVVQESDQAARLILTAT